MKKTNQTLLHINTGSVLYGDFKVIGKVRYYLIVGMSPFEYAMVCLYTKDELDIDSQFVRNLKSSFYPLTLSEFPELDFVADCSRIIVKRFGTVAAFLTKKGMTSVQKIPESSLTEIIDIILASLTICSYQKKEYNLTSY
jgi:hypothetical protein